MKRILTVLLASVVSVAALAADILPLNDGWKWHRGLQASDKDTYQIELPHTWNQEDAMFENTDYYRGFCTYSHSLREQAYSSSRTHSVILSLGDAGILRTGRHTIILRTTVLSKHVHGCDVI